MTRLNDTVSTGAGWYKGNENPVLNPKLGGTFGYASNPEEWLSAQAYKPQHLIPVVLETPRIFKHFDDPKFWQAAWKNYFEKHCRTIDGLKAGVSWEFSEHAFSGDGRMFEEYVNATRERSSLSTQTVDKYGGVYGKFWNMVGRYGMMDPETKLPLAMTLTNGPLDNLADQYSGKIAFIEPTPDGKRCQRCWIGVNIAPKSDGGVDGKMDKTSSLTPKDLSIDFTILDFINDGTRVFGQQILDGIRKYWANPNLRESFVKEVSADVLAIEQGFKESVEGLADKRIGDFY